MVIGGVHERSLPDGALGGSVPLLLPNSSSISAGLDGPFVRTMLLATLSTPTLLRPGSCGLLDGE